MARIFPKQGDSRGSFYRADGYVRHIIERVLATCKISVETANELQDGNEIISVSGARHQDQKGFMRKELFNSLLNEKFVDNSSYSKYGDKTGHNVFNTRRLDAAHTAGFHIEFKRESDDVNALVSRTILQPHPDNSDGADRVIDVHQIEFFQGFNLEAFAQDPEKYIHENFLSTLPERLIRAKGKGRNANVLQRIESFDQALEAVSVFQPEEKPISREAKRRRIFSSEPLEIKPYLILYSDPLSQ